MSIRAVILGLLLGLFIAGATYINDAVVRQTYLIGNHFPIGVFGLVLLLLIAGNPLLGVLTDRLGLKFLGGPLRAVEICLIAAIGLAACSWPGSNFYRVSNTIVSMPQHWIKNEASWKSARVESYTPGVSAEIGEGHVQDWDLIIADLRAGAAADADPVARAIWQALPPRAQRTIQTVTRDTLNTAKKNQILDAINDTLIAPADVDKDGLKLYALVARAGSLPPPAEQALERREALLAEAGQFEEQARLPGASPHARDLAEMNAGMIEGEARSLAERANRWILVHRWDGALLPAPQGEGLLIAGGRADAFAVDTLLTGRPPDSRLSLSQIPWRAWWPTIRLWGGVSLLLAIAALCLSLIVHPQWSRRELLTYPIVKFLEEASQRQQGAWLPGVAKSKLFWIGVIVPASIHMVNGLHAWFPDVPQIPLTLDFNGLKQLFPNARQIGTSAAYFRPTIYLSVIAFAFFLSAKVSFSLGISQLLFVMLGAFLIANGETMDSDYMGAKKSNLLRFGGYLGITLMILYTGRRYYLNVLGSAAGLKRSEDTPGYAPWAMRVLIVCFTLSVAVLGWGGLSWPMATIFVLLVLMIFVVMARICAETGLFFNQTSWMPVGVMTALFGAEAIGPTTYIILAFASAMIVGDPRESLMPYLTNALKFGDRPQEKTTPGRLAPWLALMIVVAFVVAGLLTISMQYNDGINAMDYWARKMLPGMPYQQLSSINREMSADGTLAASTAAQGLERLKMIRPEKGTVFWLLVGGALVIGTAAARLRFPWWPIHPVLFLVWGTFPVKAFAFSFLLGWMVKVSVTKTAGAKGYHDVKPLMVGVIAGELCIALVWMLVGALYYYTTGFEPRRYQVFPG